jgi:aldehyde:ferredoxin oxidoreductase
MAYHGVAGKILWVDLSEGKHWTQDIPEDTYRQFLGGYGLGVRILYENMPAGADPLGPDNIMGITAGIMTGVETPFSGRTQTVAKSPLTGTWADSNRAGFGSRLKKAGYDGIFIRGKADRPVYVFVRTTGRDPRRRAPLGKDTHETYDSIVKEIGGRATRPGVHQAGGAAAAHLLRDHRALPRLGQQGFAVWDRI